MLRRSAGSSETLNRNAPTFFLQLDSGFFFFFIPHPEFFFGQFQLGTKIITPRTEGKVTLRVLLLCLQLELLPPTGLADLDKGIYWPTSFARNQNGGKSHKKLLLFTANVTACVSVVAQRRGTVGSSLQPLFKRAAPSRSDSPGSMLASRSDC